MIWQAEHHPYSMESLVDALDVQPRFIVLDESSCTRVIINKELRNFKLWDNIYMYAFLR